MVLSAADVTVCLTCADVLYCAWYVAEHAELYLNCAWPCRHMSGSVYEEEHLGNFPHAVHCTGMPFPPPLRMAKHQVRCHPCFMSCCL